MKQPRILLVEDETDVLQVNLRYLTECGYEVHTAETLKAARACLWEFPPDLILLDVNLPDGSGYDFCRELRETTSAPVIFLTCLGAEGQIVTGLETGGDDYIVKPHSLHVLGARVSALLRRRGFGQGRIDLPPLSIDLSTGTATLSGEALSLTRREFSLLCYLVENRGQELSQAQIYEAVWGAGPETMGNAVKVNISRLRQKLHLDDGSSFELASTANQGYVFLRVRYP